MPKKSATFVLDEDDVQEDPFLKDRAMMKLESGEIPSMSYMEPGLSITTIEVVAMAEAKMWHNFLHQLQVANGVVVIRGLGQQAWDKDLYLLFNDMWSEIVEVVDSRPMFIINISKGDIRSNMMTLPAFADISLATPDATFGLTDTKLGAIPAITTVAMRKRVNDEGIRKLLSSGEVIDAYEAQRIGLVDFVGDVEAELARLLYRNCAPTTTTYMYKPDLEKQWGSA